MMMAVQPLVRTAIAPINATEREIVDSAVSLRAFAERYNVDQS
jgi:hypothetical protein